MNKRIEFCPDGENETVGFFVVEETRIAGVSYLLVTEAGGSVKDFCGAARGC